MDEPHRWHQLFPQTKPAHLVPVMAIVADGEPVIGVVYDPQPSRAVSAPTGPWRLAQRRSDRPHPATTVKRALWASAPRIARHGGLSAVSAGAAQRRRHVYPPTARALMSACGGGPVDWLLRAAHEPVGRPAGAGADARSGRRQQFSGTGGIQRGNPLLLANQTLYPQLKKMISQPLH